MSSRPSERTLMGIFERYPPSSVVVTVTALVITVQVGLVVGIVVVVAWVFGHWLDNYGMKR